MSVDRTLKRYVKRENRTITAVQLRLDTQGFDYSKWGATQRCNSNDWIVDNQGDVYTVDGATFASTYQEVGPGRYVKVATVWAEQAGDGGAITTKEGKTHYDAGDWLVYNGADRSDGYAMSAERFESLYEPVE